MKPEDFTRTLPDVVVRAPQDLTGALDWVGMASIQVPERFDAGNGEVQRGSGRFGAFVNLLRPQQRGIAMSRLYLWIADLLAQIVVSVASLHTLLHRFRDSQRGAASCARIHLHLELLVRRAALCSDNRLCRAYPATSDASLIDGIGAVELSNELL